MRPKALGPVRGERASALLQAAIPGQPGKDDGEGAAQPALDTGDNGPRRLGPVGPQAATGLEQAGEEGDGAQGTATGARDGITDRG